MIIDRSEVATTAEGSTGAGGPIRAAAPVYHIIIGESTPQSGGMCAHVALIADGLAEAGSEVHIWSPLATVLNCQSPAVQIHKIMGHLSPRDFVRAGRFLNDFAAPRRLLVYWVPHAYGPKAINFSICFWLWMRAAWRGDSVEPMVQECFVPFSKTSWKQSGLALVHRLMSVILLRAVRQVWIALPGYDEWLRPYALGRRIRFTWLPVPSNVAVVPDEAKVKEIRGRLAPGGVLLGHFGTFGRAITDLLEPVIPALLDSADTSFVLLGSKGEGFLNRLVQRYPQLNGRVHATGYLDDSILSSYLSACDFMIQPYPDGLTARRGSALAPLAHGRPVVTNTTSRTEALWAETRSVVFAPLSPSGFSQAVRELKQNPQELKRVSAAAKETYGRYFQSGHMIKALQRVDF